MKAGICTMPLIPLRSKPSECSEMITQLLFGELFEALDEKDSWSKIRNLSDGYVGWCTTKMLQMLPPEIVETYRNAEPLFTKALLAPCVKQGEAVPRLYLPAGSRLYFLNKETGAFPVYRTIEPGNIQPEKETWKINTDSLAWFVGKPEMLRQAMHFMNVPYLWGGKSALGIDCSGFVQVVYSMYGYLLSRDAKDQALEGVSVSSLSEAASGDLAFFSNEEEKIVHVGILLDENRILHASGSVHIDKIDNTGIFSTSLGVYTHKLCCLRRILSAGKS